MSTAAQTPSEKSLKSTLTQPPTSASTHFHAYYQAKKAAVDQALQALIEKWRNNAHQCPGTPQITEMMAYTLQAGGKRLRPILVLSVYDMLEDVIAQALSQAGEKFSTQTTLTQLIHPLALSIELIHTYSLVHDDLPAMDNAALRRNQPSCHVAFGEAEAILTGDSLLTVAFEVISHAIKTYASPAVAGWDSVSLLSRAAGHQGMINGQLLDLNAEKTPISQDTLQTLHLLKTGALIEAALLLPVVLFKLHTLIPPLQRYARAIGLAFQITDDILDHTQKSEVLGKPAQADTTNNKTTYLKFMTVPAAYEKVGQLVKSAHTALNTLSQQSPLPIQTAVLSSLAYYIYERKN